MTSKLLATLWVIPCESHSSHLKTNDPPVGARQCLALHLRSHCDRTTTLVLCHPVCQEAPVMPCPALPAAHRPLLVICVCPS